MRRGRKSLLSELSALVKTAKKLPECQRGRLVPPQNINDIVDEMILKAFKIVLKGVRFLDLYDVDRSHRLPRSISSVSAGRRRGGGVIGGSAASSNDSSTGAGATARAIASASSQTAPHQTSVGTRAAGFIPPTPPADDTPFNATAAVSASASAKGPFATKSGFGSSVAVASAATNSASGRRQSLLAYGSQSHNVSTASASSALALSSKRLSYIQPAASASASSFLTNGMTGRNKAVNNRLSFTGSMRVHRLSLGISHRMSMAGPSSSLSIVQHLVSERLTKGHDTFLSHLGSFIGRLQFQSQSRPELVLSIKQSATSGGDLLAVVDVVCCQTTVSTDILTAAREAMFERIQELVFAGHDIVKNTTPDEADVVMPQQNGVLIAAATGCVKAAGDCVAKTKWVIERIGDFEFELEEWSLGIDLSVLDVVKTESEFEVVNDAEPAEDSMISSTAESPTEPAEPTEPAKPAEPTEPAEPVAKTVIEANTELSTDAASESTPEISTEPTTTTEISLQSTESSPVPPAKTTTQRNHSKQLSIAASLDKPLPEVPETESDVTTPVAAEASDLTPAEAVADSPRSSLSRQVTVTPTAQTEDAITTRSRTPSVSRSPKSQSPKNKSPKSIKSTRFSLPPLPKLSTVIPSNANSAESGADEEAESAVTTEFQQSPTFDLMASSSAASAATFLSRDSEASMLSRTSTRATTPDGPRNKASISGLSTNSSQDSNEADDADADADAENNLLAKTYAHELMFNKEGQVTGGTIPALIERLTTHESTPDAMFVSTFYLTFRLFCTPTRFAEALVDRFEYVAGAPHMAGPVRLRVYNAFKGWLESHWRDQTDRDALQVIVPFAETTLTAVLPSAGARLLDLAQKVSNDGLLVPRLVSSMGKTNTAIAAAYIPPDTPLPMPVVTRGVLSALNSWKTGGLSPSILDFDPMEFARQLTLKQMAIFSSIMPEELLGSQWMKNGGVDAPNVKAMSGLSTDLSNFVAENILGYTEVKKRAAAIKQWIKIAQALYELNNYDGLMAIICRLNSSTITRLRRTWDIISPKRREMLTTLQAVVEPAHNHKALRSRLVGHVPPCLPFLGMYLTDLTFVDIGNQATKQLHSTLPLSSSDDAAPMSPSGDDTPSGGITLVNFDKHMRTAKIIGELQRFQIPYRFAEVPEMQEWITTNLTRVHGNDQSNVQVTYYRQSLKLEPREAIALQRQTTTDAPPTPGLATPRTDYFLWRSKDRAGSIAPTS
ncbi:hypothetical protein TD95_004418 [Thielaviopsis punctulata]|uniref:Ras-GEF domain-containing protein n=1 Tax=Thielaviopsis punctulata TaxID=72032 RepID=A0A0F4ZE02_9PEZI|nr:hypothetical protein TD95_004418 [Thielaviopsis punctulata]